VNKKIIPLFLCFLVFISCSGENKDWKNAESENSITAYEDFLKQYPQGEFADEAQLQIEAIYFEKAEAVNTIEAYADFLKHYSEGEFADEAQSQIKAIYFEKAEAANTIEAYADFLKRYSEGEFADKARFKIEAIYFDQAKAAIGTWEGKTSQGYDITIEVEMVSGSPTVTGLKYAIRMSASYGSTTKTLSLPTKLSATVTDSKFNYSGSDYELSGVFTGKTLKGNLSSTDVHPQGYGTATANVTFVLKKNDANK